MEITIRIKLINGFRPTGIEGYKRAPKLPIRLRSCDADSLNRFVKTMKVIDENRMRQEFNLEVSKIGASANFKIKGPNYGDKLIGSIDNDVFDDLGFELYVPVKANK